MQMGLYQQHKKHTGLGWASLILGVVALVMIVLIFVFIFVFSYTGIFLGLIFSFVAFNRSCVATT